MQVEHNALAIIELRDRADGLPWGNDSEVTQVLLIRAADALEALYSSLRQCKIVLECLSADSLVEQRMAALANARVALAMVLPVPLEEEGVQK